MDTTVYGPQGSGQLKMITHWLTLFLGLGLGLVPPRLLASSEVRYVEFEDLWTKVLRPSDNKVRRRRWWKLPLVWIDPVRGYMVTWLLTQSFEVLPEEKSGTRLLAVGLVVGIKLITIWVQSASRKEAGQTVCPTGFLAGMVVATFPVTVWPAIVLLGAATAISMQSFVSGFFAAGMTALALGYIFMGLSPTLVGGLAVMGVPVMLNWFRRSRLVMTVRY